MDSNRGTCDGTPCRLGPVLSRAGTFNVFVPSDGTVKFIPKERTLLVRFSDGELWCKFVNCQRVEQVNGPTAALRTWDSDLPICVQTGLMALRVDGQEVIG